MFGKKSISWKKNKTTLARYIRLDSIHKTLKKKIELDTRKDKVLVFTDNLYPEVIISERFNTIDFGNKDFVKKYNSILFWCTSVISVKQLPIKHRIGPKSPWLNGTIDFNVKIDFRDNLDDGAGKRLVDGFFTGNSKVEVLDSEAIKKILKNIIEEGKIEFLEGVNENNLFDDKTQLEIKKNTKKYIDNSMNSFGLNLIDINIKWQPTSGHITEAKGAKNEALKNRNVVDLDALMNQKEKAAIQSLGNEGSKALEDKMKELTAAKVKEKVRAGKGVAKAQADNEINLEKIKGDSAAKLAETEGDAAVKLARAKIEAELAEIAAQTKEMHASTDLTIDERRKESKRIDDVHNEELKKLKSERDINEMKAQVEGFKQIIEELNTAKQTGASDEELQEYRQILKGILLKDNEGKTFDVSSVIHEDTMSDLENGKYGAEQIDNLSENMRMRTSDPSLSREQIAYMWAGVAIFERFRGNKNGKMIEALTNSFELDENNPVALKCKMDYLWNRHPQQFFKGKMKVEHLRNQVIEIEDLLIRIIEHKAISENEREETKIRHQKALVTLSRDEENGEKYQNKLRDLYGILNEVD